MSAARLAPALLALCCTAAQAGEVPAWSLDPVHTRVMFAVDHAGFSKAIGTVSGSRGMLRYDPGAWVGASIDIEVPVSRIDLGDADWNAATLAPRLLDAQRHPWARFVSTRVEPIDAEHARVCGELTLRAVTQPLCLDVTVNQVRRHPLPPFRRTAGFSATGTLSRAAFGMDAWSSVIGDSVELRIEAEAIRSRALAPPGSEKDPDTATEAEAEAEADTMESSR